MTDFHLAGGHVDFIDIQPAHRLPHTLNFRMDLRSGSIFNIALGQSATWVRNTLGQPDDRFQDRADRQIGWDYASRLIFTVYFGRGSQRVASLETQDPRVRTATGLGLGSTEGQITRSNPGATCGTDRAERYCDVGGRNVVTTFYFKHGHVYDITTSRL
ncbi:MAG: hypothetical protein NVS4B2_23290 [Chloroflexota bacterium]